MAANRFLPMIYKLQQALAQKDIVIFVNRNQFWSESQHRQITMYYIYETEFDADKHRRVQHEVMRTILPVDVVIYLANRYKGLEMLSAMGEVQKHQTMMQDKSRVSFNTEDFKSATRMKAVENRIIAKNDERFGIKNEYD